MSVNNNKVSFYFFTIKHPQNKHVTQILFGKSKRRLNDETSLFSLSPLAIINVFSNEKDDRDKSSTDSNEII
jgi:hypothetical protein